MSDTIRTDVAIIGAGIAGAGLAAEIASSLDVVLLEQESRPGYHSTGRSAAIFIRNYGNAVIRALSRASAPLFENADPAFFPTPLLSQRGVLNVAGRDGLEAHAALLAESDGLRELAPEEAMKMVPLLRPEWVAAAAYEEDAQDIDVAALHEGWLRKARSGSCRSVAEAPVRSGRHDGSGWVLETPGQKIHARLVVNAAGAWADVVAAACGVPPLGLQPMRRSMAVLPAPAGQDLGAWPLVADSAEGWYCKPDAGRLLVSPAEEVPVDPHDAFVDDMVLAEGLYRFEQAMAFPVTRVERSWAGLRTFAPDRTPVAGFDPAAEGFFWLAGQGGYGIQTSPALSRLAGQLLRGEQIDAPLAACLPALSPARFRPSAAQEPEPVSSPRA